MDPLKTLELRGRRVSFVDQGQGEPLLLVHGFPLDHSMWQHQIDFFKSNYRVICPDLPGFGASESLVTESVVSTEPVASDSKNQFSFSMESFADWLIDFLDAVDCQRSVNFCGLSMGGYIGWQFWRRHSSRLKSIIAANTRAAADDELVRRARHMAAAQVRVSGADPVADTMVQKLFYLPNAQNALDIDYVSQTHRIIKTTASTSIAAGQIGMSQRADATAWLSEIKLPMLFIGGEFDEITTPVEMQSDADKVSQSQFEVISTAGHLTPLEQPTAFNAAVNRFLSQS